MYNISSGRTKRPGHTANKQVDDDMYTLNPFVYTTTTLNDVQFNQLHIKIPPPLIFYPNLNEKNNKKKKKTVCLLFSISMRKTITTTVGVVQSLCSRFSARTSKLLKFCFSWMKTKTKESETLPPSGKWRRRCCTFQSAWWNRRCQHRRVWTPLK